MTRPALCRRGILAVFGLALAIPPLGLGLATAQQATFNEREVKSQPSGLDKDTVWSLDFKFKDPRIIKAFIPGRGTRLCWYLWYQVVNRTPEPRLFIPEFELVTLDFPGSYPDEVLPAVQRAVIQVEDPSSYQDIQNSVTIAAKPIPPSRAEDAYPRAITGVAIWDASGENPGAEETAAKQLSETTRFSVFVSGLSNGWVLVDPNPGGSDPRPIVRRKTLQLNFKRTGGRFAVNSREFSFQPPAEWIYRSTRLRIPNMQPAAQQPANGAGNPKGARLGIPNPFLVNTNS